MTTAWSKEPSRIEFWVLGLAQGFLLPVISATVFFNVEVCFVGLFLFAFVVGMGTSGIGVRVEWGIALLLGTFPSLFFYYSLFSIDVKPTNLTPPLIFFLAVLMLPIAALLAFAGVSLGVLTKSRITRLAKNKIPYGTLSTRLFLYSALAVVMVVVTAMGLYGLIGYKERARWDRPFPILAGPGAESVKALLEAGADVNAKTFKYGWTALMWAAQKGHTETVKALLEAGADVNAKAFKYGWTALMWAAQKGHTETVKALLEAGADVNAKTFQYGWTALIWAAQEGHTDVARDLLAAGADVHARDIHGKTVLMWATDKGHTDVARDLLAAGADVRAQSTSGWTTLMWAAWRGHLDIVQALIAKGADVNAKSNKGGTALMWAALMGHAEVVRALTAAGADVNAKDIGGRTALIAAAKEGHTEVVQLLKQAGAKE